MKSRTVSKKIKGKWIEFGFTQRQFALGFGFSKHDFYLNVLWLWISVEF